MNRPIREKKKPVKYDASEEANEPRSKAKPLKKVKRKKKARNTNGEGSSKKIKNTPPIPMNLLSCPEEMLASVLKYTKFQTVTRIRKTNKHMDYIATKYRINLPRVKTIGISSYGGAVPNIHVSYGIKRIWDRSFIYGDHRIYPKIRSYDSVLDLFEGILKKINPTNYTATFDYGMIDQNLVDIIKSPRFSKKVSLSFENCNFEIPLEELTSLLAKYTNSEMTIKSHNRIMDQLVATDEIVLAVIPYAEITYSSDRHGDGRPAFTDKVLRAACRYMPYRFDVGRISPFSVEEVKKTMIRLIECYEQKEKKLSRWELGRLIMDSQEQLDWATAELLSIPRTKATYYYGTTKRQIWYHCDEESFDDIFQINLELR